MKWKRGDQVLVRSESTIQLFDNQSLNDYPWYRQWCGKIVTIMAVVDDNSYIIAGSDAMGHDLWIDESFEPIPGSWNPIESIPEYELIM